MIQIELAKNSNQNQNQNPHPIWERESEWEKEGIRMRERERIHHRRHSKPPHHRRQSPNHHAVAADLQSLLPILISNPRQKFKANQNPHLIWQRESEWEKERILMIERERIHHRRRSKPLCHRRRSPNHHAIAADLQSLLLILISNPRQSERPTTKIQSKPKPTSNLRERIKVRERENPPSPPLQTTTPLLSISNRRAPARWWLTPTCSP